MLQYYVKGDIIITDCEFSQSGTINPEDAANSRERKDENRHMMMNKTMTYIDGAQELILNRLEDDDIPLMNLTFTCLERGTEVHSAKEAIRDSLTGDVCHSDAYFHARLYYIDGSMEYRFAMRTAALIKGLDIAQWAIDMLPQSYGSFAIMLRPKEAPQDASQRKVWVFMVR